MTDKAALKTISKRPLGKDGRSSTGAAGSSSLKLPLLEAINRKFLGFVSQRLKEILLHDVSVEMVSLSAVKVRDYLQGCKKNSLIVQSSISPLKGTALITIEPLLLDKLVDNYFGGHGAFGREENVKGFTCVEYRMAEKLLCAIYSSYETVFSPLKKIVFGFMGCDSDPLLNKTVSADDSLVISRFRVDTGSGCAVFDICLQNATLVPVKNELSGEIPSGFFDKLSDLQSEDENNDGSEKKKSRASGVSILAKLKPLSLAALINSEHPQVKAVILASLKPEFALKALTHASCEVLSSLISRLATLTEVSSEACRDFNDIIKYELIKTKGEKVNRISGIKNAAAILKLFPPKIRELVLKTLSAREPKLGLSIRYRLVGFSDLFLIDPLSLQELLRNINYSTLQAAMSSLDKPKRDFLYKNLSRKISGELQKDLAAMKPIEKTAVENARQEILDLACDLADKEAIVLISENVESNTR